MVRRLIVLLAFSAISASILAAVRGISYSQMLFTGEGGSPTPPPPYVPSEIGEPVKFTGWSTTGAETVSMFWESVGDFVPAIIQVSSDGVSWFDVRSSGKRTFIIPSGGSAFFRANPLYPNTGLYSSPTRYSYFGSDNASARFAVSGDVMTLLNSTTHLDTIPSENCFVGVFQGLDITTAPLLSARNLKAGCYKNMFRGCRYLQKVETLQTSFTGCDSWLDNVPSTGTFICPSALGSDSTIQRGASACPTGWSVVNK